MNHPDKKAKMLEWLEMPEGRHWLEQLAISAVKWLKRENLLESFLEEPQAVYTFSGDKNGRAGAFSEETIDAVKNELFIFLMESSKTQDVFAFLYGESGGYLLTGFINHCRDKSRSITASPRKFFRRAALDVIRNAADLSSSSIGTGKKGGFSGAYGRGTCGGVIEPLSDEEKREIPFTVECQQVFFGARKNAMMNRSAMYTILCIFLDHAALLKGKPGMWVRVDDFIDWLMHNRPCDLPITPDMFDKTRWQNEDGNCHDVDDMLPDYSIVPDAAWYDGEKIASWASMCAAILTMDERDLLFQKLAKDQNPRQISESRGNISRNTVENRINRAFGKIQAFLVDKPWVSFDDLNEDAFSFFMDIFIRELENIRLTP